MHSTGTSKYTGTTSYHPTSVTAPSRGAASGLKTKNKYLQEFEKVKAGYAQRTQAKKLGTKFPGGSSLPPRQGQGLGQGQGSYGGRQGQRIPGMLIIPTTLSFPLTPYISSSYFFFKWSTIQLVLLPTFPQCLTFVSPFIPQHVPPFINSSDPSEWYRDKTRRSTHQPTTSRHKARGRGRGRGVGCWRVNEDRGGCPWKLDGRGGIRNTGIATREKTATITS